MTKADIISDVSKSTGFTKVEVEILLDSVIFFKLQPSFPIAIAKISGV